MGVSIRVKIGKKSKGIGIVLLEYHNKDTDKEYYHVKSTPKGEDFL